MNTSTKLTLSVDANVVLDAKKYASEHSHSLSHLVENYFRSLTMKKSQQQASMMDGATPTVDELQRLIEPSKTKTVLQQKSYSAQSDRQLMTDHILDKYAV